MNRSRESVRVSAEHTIAPLRGFAAVIQRGFKKRGHMRVTIFAVVVLCVLNPIVTNAHSTGGGIGKQGESAGIRQTVPRAECSPLAQTAKQTPQTKPTSAELEQRNQPVTEDDLRILLKATEILKDESVWNRKDDRVCDDDESNGKRSLFCALQKACIDVLGEYDHRRVALQEVRFAVQDATRGRDFEHRLRDFNNLPETKFDDMKRILGVATERVKSRLKQNAQ